MFPATLLLHYCFPFRLLFILLLHYCFPFRLLFILLLLPIASCHCLDRLGCGL